MFSKLPISVVIKIIELFIIDNKNCLQIIKSLKDFYHVDTVNSKLDYNILSILRKYLAQYLKELYYNPMINENEGGYITVDESLFSNFMTSHKYGL